jgi:hypothetical protein
VTGRVSDLDTAELGILEAALSSRFGGRLFDIYMRDDLEAAGASEDDWALALELSYQTIRHGLTGVDLARTVERIMRSGPYRQKWDDARGGVTWLAQDVGNAIATVQKRLADRPTLRIVHDDFEEDEQTAAETAEEAVARLRRELAKARATIAVQQTVIKGERGRRDSLEQFVTGIDGVLSRKDLSSTDKVMTIVAARELHTRVSKGIYTISRGRLADLAGVSESTVTTSLKRICTSPPKYGSEFKEDGRPFKRLVTRKQATDPETGAEIYVSSLEVTPWAPTARETLQAAATFTVPQDRPKHGGSEAATEAAAKARRDGCRKHQDADVVVRGVCTECGDVLAARRLPADEWSTLKEQASLSESHQPVSVVPKGEQVALSEPPPPLFPPAMAGSTEVCDVHGRFLTASELKRGTCSWCASGPPAPEVIGHGRQVSGPRCGRLKRSGRECVSTMYSTLPGGALHCLGCGHDSSPLAAVAGGEK